MNANKGGPRIWPTLVGRSLVLLRLCYVSIPPANPCKHWFVTLLRLFPRSRVREMPIILLSSPTRFCRRRPIFQDHGRERVPRSLISLPPPALIRHRSIIPIFHHPSFRNVVPVVQHLFSRNVHDHPINIGLLYC